MIWPALAKRRVNQIEYNLSRAGETQSRLLSQILKTLEGCELTRQYGLDRQTAPDVFAKSVPITTYADYEGLVARALQGHVNVLFPGHPVCIAQTGGTTSQPKLIPLGRQLIKSYRQFNLDMAFKYMCDSGAKDIFSGKIFLVAANPSAEHSDRGIPIGRVTGIMASIAPYLLRRRYVPGLSVIRDTDTLQKIRKTTEAALVFRDHIHVAAGLTPYLISAWEDIQNKARQQNLGTTTIGELFPRLSVAFHGGTTFDLYQERIRRLTGPSVDHWNVYSAAEGPIAFQYAQDIPGLMPFLDGVYFEFVPEEASVDDASKSLGIEQVSCGVPYQILLTTQGGLLRYRIGDVVEFLSLDPPLFRVIGRKEDHIDLSGEKLSSDLAERALARVCREFGLTINDFLVCPKVSPEGQYEIAHEWIIECCVQPENSHDLCLALDRELAHVNYRYAQLREHGNTLGEPALKLVPPGTFARYMLAEMGYGQQKIVHMNNDRRVAERVLSHAKP